MSWSPFTLPQMPPQVTAFGESIASASDGLTTLLLTLQAAAKVLSAADITVTDATQLALQTAIKELTAEIDTLSGATAAASSTANQVGVYLLLVPARRKVVIQAALAKAMEAAGITQLPQIPTDGAVGKLLATAGSSTFLNSVPGATGGNAGFLRTVVESMTDTVDPNRPQLDADISVTGAVMVAGASSYANIIQISNLVSAIFATQRPADTLELPETPHPADLTAIQTADGVQLTWTNPGITTLAAALGTVFTIKQTAIIRSTSPKLLSATSATSLFGSATLAAGQKTGDAQVLAVLDPVAEYLDDTVTDQRSYYYAACYRVEADGVDLGFGRLSAVRKVTPQDKPPRTAAAQPPDWIRTPSAITLVPDLSGVLASIKAQLVQLGNTGTDFKSLSDSYVAQVDAEIKRYTDLATGINDKIKAISTLLGQPTPTGAYFRRFAGRGGNAFLVSDLAASLSGTDTTRPPFDVGDEFVTGFVILAAGPTSASLAPVNTFLDTLFGTGGTVESALTKALSLVTAGVDQAISDVTAALLANNTYGQSPTPVLVPKVGIDDDGTNQNC